jgi:hypothetical protein
MNPMPVELNIEYNIPREERICHLCKETIGDEYHFSLVCKNENIITLRNKYLPNYYRAYPNHAKRVNLSTRRGIYITKPFLNKLVS